ncbi:MAG: ERCC4 domain-containing protein [Candidatus Aenigmatarchaeota archaeon]
MAFEEGVKIFADNRENGAVISELERLCVIEKKNLPVGDYVCSDRVVVERKSESDFASSIMDGRLFSQMKELCAYEKPILLIEKNGQNISRIHPNAIRGALASLALDFSVPIIFSQSYIDTAGIIFQIAKREQVEDKRTLSIRPKAGITSMEKHQEFLVAGLPSVSTVLAKRMLARFGTPQKIFSASEKELQEIDGIGGEKAKRVFEMLNSEYSE